MFYIDDIIDAQGVADFFNAVDGDLAANGRRVRAAADRVYFDESTLEYLRGHRTPEEDGHISVEDGQLVMWLAGDPYEVHRES